MTPPPRPHSPPAPLSRREGSKKEPRENLRSQNVATDLGREDLPQLPADWQWVKLGEICAKIQDGSHFSPQVQHDSPGKNRFMYITAKNIRNNYMDLRNVKYVDQEFHDSIYNRCNPEFGDVLLTKDGVNTGQVTLNTIREPFSLLSSVCIFKADRSKLQSEILKYFIQSPLGSRAILDSMTGTAIKRIILGKIKNAFFPLPPLATQQAIVAKIEELFTELDKGIESIKLAQQQLKTYRQSVLKAAFEGALTPSPSPIGRGEKEGLPAGWKWSNPDELRQAANNSICAGPFGTIFKAKDFRKEGVPIIFLRHVKAGFYNTRKPNFMDRAVWKKLFQDYSVYGGELLITKLGEPPGECCIYPKNIGPAMVTPDVIKMNVNEAVCEPSFLMHYFNSAVSRKALEDIAFGTTRLRITLPIFRKLRIPLPPLAEQQAIVAAIESRFSVADSLEATLAQSLEKAEALRQSILKQAFAGALV